MPLLMKLLAFLMIFAFVASTPLVEAQARNGADTELSPQEKRTIAFHEAGHATVSWLLLTAGLKRISV